MPKVCFYVDNSNIFHEGQRFARNNNEDGYRFRIYFPNFVKLCLGDNAPDELVWAGSIPPPDDSVWEYLRNELNIEPDLLERSGAGEQETVDHLIQLKMHRHLRKYKDDPGVIILATGDGKGYEEEDGFLYDVEGFVEDGWKIRLLSWEHSCHRRLRSFAEKKGEFIPLDRYYNNISFIKNDRIVERL